MIIEDGDQSMFTLFGGSGPINDFNMKISHWQYLDNNGKGNDKLNKSFWGGSNDEIKSYDWLECMIIN